MPSVVGKIESAMAKAVVRNMDVKLGGDYPLAANSRGTNPLRFLHYVRDAPHRADRHSLVDGISRLRDSSAPNAGGRSDCPYHSRLRNVKLENVGPVRLNYRQDEVRVEQANLRGTIRIFTLPVPRACGDRALSLRVDGAVHLQLLRFVPHLENRWPAQINAAVAGT